MKKLKENQKNLDNFLKNDEDSLVSQHELIKEGDNYFNLFK